MKKEKVTEQKTVVAAAEKEVAENKMNIYKMKKSDFFNLPEKDLMEIIQSDYEESIKTNARQALQALWTGKTRTRHDEFNDLENDLRVALAGAIRKELEIWALKFVPYHDIAFLGTLDEKTQTRKEKNSHSLFSTEVYTVSPHYDGFPIKLAASVTLDKNVGQKVLRAALKDKATDLYLKAAEEARQSVIDRLWNVSLEENVNADEVYKKALEAALKKRGLA